MCTNDSHFPIVSGSESVVFQDQRTGDYFASYDTFFEHVLSEKFPQLVGKNHWLEPISGKSLTWHERTLPKKDVSEYKTSLDFNVELALLTMVPITPMRSLDSLVNTLFEYFEKRFMKNEIILVFQGSSWVPGKIVHVDTDLVLPENVILDGTEYLPHHFLYDVALVDTLVNDGNYFRKNVRCSDLRRAEGAFSRVQLRSSILQHCKCREPRKASNVWCLKDKTVDLFDLNNISWWDMFAGPEPRFTIPSKSSKRFPREEKLDKHAMDHQKLKKDQKNLLIVGKTSKTIKDLGKGGSIKRKREDDSQPSSSSKKKKYSFDYKKGLVRGERSATKAKSQEDRKLKQKEYKKRWKEKLAKEREKLSKKWAQVFTVGEDLQSPNLKPIPVIPKRLSTNLPDQYIGDGLFVLEFLRIFGVKFDKSSYSSGLMSWNLNDLHAAVVSDTIEGEFFPLLGFFAKAVMSCVPPKFMESDDPAVFMHRGGWELSGLKIVQSTRSKIGLPFNNLPVSDSTISEIIRMCLLVASLSLRSPGSTEPKSDGVVLRYLNSPAGAAMYKVIYGQSVFALSFEQRMELVVLLTQAVMESDLVRETVENLNSAADDSERNLRVLKQTTEEVSRICKAKIAVTVAKDRPADKSSEKGDRFRQILEAYTRKRSDLRSDKGRTTQALVDDIRALGEGRRKRRLSDGDMLALTEALVDLQRKFDHNIQEEKTKVSEAIYSKKQNVRLEPIGMDRHFFHYWFLPTVPSILIERAADSSRKICCAGCLCEVINKGSTVGEKGSSWWVISQEDQAMLSKNLLIHGEREVALKRSMDNHVAYMSKQLDEADSQKLLLATSDLSKDVPEIVPKISCEDQLFAQLISNVTALESKLQKTRLGGFQPPDKDRWVARMRRFPDTNDNELDVGAVLNSVQTVPSPEIFASKEVGDEQVYNPLTNGICLPDSSRTDTVKIMDIEGSEGKGAIPAIGLETDKASSGGYDEEEDNVESESRTSQKSEASGRVLAETHNKNLKHLIQCILELVDTVRLRYIGAPLVTINEQSNKDGSQLEQWKTSLQSCSSLSQMNLHLTVFEHCILWNKAVVGGLCKQCRKKGEADNLVVCDGCDRIFHFYCIDPPVTEIPKELWYCMICKPPPPVPRTRRTRHNVNYNESANTSQENVGDVAPPPVTDPNRPKISDRAARALQRSQALYGERDSVHSEDSSGAQSADADGVRRSARSKRVDYKELVDGGVKDVPSRASSIEEQLTEEDLEYVNGDFHVENESQSGSEDSEYDPESSPKWGKKHKKHKVSRR